MELKRNRTPIPAHSTLRLDGQEGSASIARAHAGDFLTGPCDPPLTSARIADALILISELVTNAARHAPGPCVLDMVYDGTALFIAVSDTSASLPRPRPGDLHTGTGGFGWNLLSSLTMDIHITRYTAGWKTIVTTLAAQTS
ncbi:ATP-binding protein [Streptacidiphilus sp. PB12-B1b]|uniref:ATP-binding protein n=1 Tax=Streptacidiphilus sp. PB12-B1b TaxID=2705012 RepID=UPI0015FA5BAC|nr:ATP-binding protein [Streptacidiphilus sp. PB12-B1b]QMU77224.1 ATP-binding protein [Streptacidiphilus sp. PB12-B1b]